MTTTLYVIAHVDEGCSVIRLHSVICEGYETALYSDLEGAEEVADDLCNPALSYRDWIPLKLAAVTQETSNADH